MTDRFKLESSITDFLHIIEDLEWVIENRFDEDTVHNVLLFMRLKHDILWDTFISTYKLDKYKEN